MAKNMSAIISTLGVVLQTLPYHTSTSTAFFHDLLQLYIPVGGHVELRVPIGDIPQGLSAAVHQPQRGTITVSVGLRRYPVPKKKLQILLVESEEALLKLNETEQAAGFTPLAESHIIVLLPPGYSFEKVSTALSICWRSSFGTCLAVLQPDHAAGVYDFYFSPLELQNNKRCISQHALPSHINRWAYGIGFENNERTTQPIIRDFQGCLILVAPNYVQPYFFHKGRTRGHRDLDVLSHFGGLDAALLTIIAEKSNLTVRVLSKNLLRETVENSQAEDGDDDELAKFTGDGSDSFIAVLQNDADLVAGGYVPTEWRFKSMHITRAYARDVLMWYIPAYEEVTWARLTVCFSTTVWVLLGVTFCAIATLRLLIASKENDSHPILTLWGIWTESGRHPKYRTASEVLLGVTCIIFSLHVVPAYRAGLATSLAAGPLYDDITDEELYVSDFALIIPEALKGIVGDLLREHRGRRFSCSSSKRDCIRALMRPERIALLINANMMMMEAPIHLMDARTGVSMVRTIRGTVLTYPIQMYMAKGHMLRPVFDEKLQWITDAGFPLRYMAMALWRATHRRRARKGGVLPLSFHHLAGAFTLLWTGLTTAFFVALCEASSRKRFIRSIADCSVFKSILR